jgi:hypothetical protein
MSKLDYGRAVACQQGENRMTSRATILRMTAASRAERFTPVEPLVPHVPWTDADYAAHHAAMKAARTRWDAQEGEFGVIETQTGDTEMTVYIKPYKAWDNTVEFYVGFDPSDKAAHVCSRLGSYFICVSNLFSAQAIARGAARKANGNVVLCEQI